MCVSMGGVGWGGGRLIHEHSGMLVMPARQ